MRQWLVSFPSLLDLSLLRALGISFLIGFVALVMIFNIFTIFELWRFIAADAGTEEIVPRYLFYLFPLGSVELFPGGGTRGVALSHSLIARGRDTGTPGGRG